MRFISETSSGGVFEQLFTLGEIPGVLWTPDGATGVRPLILIGHGGGQHKQAPGVVARARRFVTAGGFAVAAVDVPGHGDRPTDEEYDRIATQNQARVAAGEDLAPLIAGFQALLARPTPPEWRAGPGRGPGTRLRRRRSAGLLGGVAGLRTRRSVRGRRAPGPGGGTGPGRGAGLGAGRRADHRPGGVPGPVGRRAGAARGEPGVVRRPRLSGEDAARQPGPAWGPASLRAGQRAVLLRPAPAVAPPPVVRGGPAGNGPGRRAAAGSGVDRLELLVGVDRVGAEFAADAAGL